MSERGVGRWRSTTGRLTLFVLLAAGLVLLIPGVARAQSDLDRVIGELRRDPVVVDPATVGTIVDAGAADRLRSAIDEAGTPIVVAVLPDGTDPCLLVEAIGNGLGRPVTVAVVAGGQFCAASSSLTGVGALADAALQANGGEGAEALLLGFISRVDQATASGTPAERSQPEPTASENGSLLPLGLLVLGGGALGFAALQRKRRRDEQRQREFEEVRTAAHEDLVALGEDIRDLDLDISMPGVDPKAVDDYTAALECYQRASEAFDRARQAEDLAAVTAALDDGRFQMTSAKARLRGEEPPEHRLPCFFDPRHGPSVTDVEWAPHAGAPRMVPACAADALRLREGLEPESRQVLVNGAPTPYWNAPGAFAPWAGGYFGMAGGSLLTGLLIGSALGGWGGYGYEDGGDFGGGDFGGGDFGGGDFGGGDFGGGDFGGGDFGGGDF